MRESAGDRKPLLLLNLDETSIKLCPATTRGYVVFDLRGRRAILRQGPRPSLSERRSAVSLVCIICNDQLIQPLLPQVFVVNEHVLSESEVAELNSTCPRNVFFSRRRSSWVNAPLLCEIISLLAECLRGVRRTHNVFLSMDTFRAHLHVSVLRACTEAGFFIMYVPALTTGWLQPLDVCVFSKYKLWVVRELERRRLASATGQLSRLEVMDVYRRGLPKVLESQSWARAFALTGLSGQDHLAVELQKRLRWDESVAVPSTLPSLAELRCVYPRRSHIPLEDVFALVVRREEFRFAPAGALRLPLRARLPAIAPAASL